MEAIDSNIGQPRAADGAIPTPSPEIATLMDRKAAGETLSASEHGKLGAFARWLKNPFGKSGAAAEPDLPARPHPRGAPFGRENPLAAVPSAQAPVDSLPTVEIDDSVCQRVASAILGRGNQAAVGWIEREAKSALATIRATDQERDKMLARFRLKASLPNDDQKLIVELAPDVCRELEINPRQFAVWTVGGVLVLHGFNLWQCVQELKDFAKKQAQPKEEKEPETKPKAPVENLASLLPPQRPGAANREGVSTTSIPMPSQPKGAPPNVT